MWGAGWVRAHNSSVQRNGGRKKRLRIIISEFNLAHAVTVRDAKYLRELGVYFNKIRRKRGTARRQANDNVF